MKCSKIANFGKRNARSGKNQVKSCKDTLQNSKKRLMGEGVLRSVRLHRAPHGDRSIGLKSQEEGENRPDRHSGPGPQIQVGRGNGGGRGGGVTRRGGGVGAC